MTSTTTLESNKQVVAAFYEAAFNTKDFTAAAGYLADNYVQHNPLIADGAEGLRARLDHLKENFPALSVEVKRMIAEGDYVCAHVHAVRVPGQRGVAIMDIFRLADGKLTEHWDVLQDIPAEALNQNGMF
ncbi:nuclear transport factor 2 family protein [Nocardia pneumoniae]|uniref:nuclear transport factor 2 family protein n=1 Tax=Nocardia pneumoniae TaxID=228601 RepID=UPI000307354F|nr:nuclear transport factor 2 family protein [Nocardia pneumoniae]